MYKLQQSLHDMHYKSPWEDVRKFKYSPSYSIDINGTAEAKNKIKMQMDGVCFACPITDWHWLLLSARPDSAVFRRCEKKATVRCR